MGFPGLWNLPLKTGPSRALFTKPGLDCGTLPQCRLLFLDRRGGGFALGIIRCCRGCCGAGGFCSAFGHGIFLCYSNNYEPATQPQCAFVSDNVNMGLVKRKRMDGLADFQHDFTDMRAGFHPRMGSRRIGQRIFAVHHRRYFARRQQGPDMGAQLVRDPRFGQIGLWPQC